MKKIKEYINESSAYKTGEYLIYAIGDLNEGNCFCKIYKSSNDLIKYEWEDGLVLSESDQFKDVNDFTTQIKKTDIDKQLKIQDIQYCDIRIFKID